MFLRWARLFCCILYFASIVSAQLNRGFISGTVQDAAGSVIAGAQVKIRNTATGIENVSQTNSLGFYRFVAVEPGTYSVEFSQQGFRAKRLENIVVNAASEPTVNAALELSPVETVIDVIEAPYGVELAKATASISRTLNERVVEQMPTTAGLRNINTLALLTPLAARTTLVSSGISANGQRPRNNSFIIDGVDNNDPSITVENTRMLPEAVQEFQVQTAAYSAEFGRSSGAQIMAITRSGTNEFHGSAWDYFTSNWLTANSLNNKRAGVMENPRFNQNQAGGSIGGPILKNRLFFFQLLETNRFRAAPSPTNAVSTVIPTPEGYQLLRSLPLGPNQTTESRQQILRDLEFLPTVYPQIGAFANPTNLTINGVSIPVGQAFVPVALPNDYWAVTTRGDWSMTDKDRFMYRLNYDKRVDPNVVSNRQFGQLFNGDSSLTGQNHAFSYTRTLRSNLINEGRYAYIVRDLFFPERSDRSTVNITGLFQIGGAANYPQGRQSNVHQFQDVATHIAGRHSLKFGADIRRTTLNNIINDNVKGTWTFNNLQDFLNNQPARLVQALSTASFNFTQTNQFYFVQDDIRLHRDFVLNLGLRYEYQNIPAGFFGAANEQVAGIGVQRNVRTDKNNWAPRGGFAWSPSGSGGGRLRSLLGDGQTVVRGGYGIGYDVLFFNLAIFSAQNYPRVNVSETFNPTTYPNLAPRQEGAPPFNPLSQFVNTATDAENPTTHFYSLSVQRQFARNFIFEIGYSGSRSYHQIRQTEYNPATLTPAQAATVRQTGQINSIDGAQARRLNPLWGSRVVFETTAIGNYNAGFLRLDKRFSNGLSFGANYTYSGTFSDNDESLGVTELATTPNIPQDYRNYRPEYSRSVFDRPHRTAFYYTYDLPWFKDGVLGGRLLTNVLGNWQITGFTDFQSGIPFTVRTVVDTLGLGTAGGARPDWNPSGILLKDPVTNDFRTFTSPLIGGAFVTPLTTQGTPLANSDPDGGNLGRNTFRSPSWQNWNFSFVKKITFTERWTLELRNDWINGFNHRNFRTPSSNMSSPVFGQQVNDPGFREMLFAAKVRF